MDLRPLRREDFLVGVEVRGGEVDVLFAFTGDRERPHDQVHLTRLERRLSLARFDHLQVDAVRIAEDGPRNLAGEVDVETLQPTRARIAEPERIGVLVDTDDQSSALCDGGHCRTGRHGTLRRHQAGSEAGFGVAAVGIRRIAAWP